jgi:hypothetical protein
VRLRTYILSKKINIKSSQKRGMMMKYLYSSNLAQISFPFVLAIALSQAISIDNNPNDILNALFETSIQNISLFL